MDYLKRTLQALPPGTVLDSAGYAGAGHNSWCEDEPKDPGQRARRCTSRRSAIWKVPGMDPETIIDKAGDAWRSWGWHVFERDGFEQLPTSSGTGSETVTGHSRRPIRRHIRRPCWRPPHVSPVMLREKMFHSRHS